MISLSWPGGRRGNSARVRPGQPAARGRAVPPVSNSPYLPMTRLYISPLYLRIEDIPEYAALPAADRAAIDELAAPLRAANSTPELIDRDAVWAAKRRALELISQVAADRARAGRLRRVPRRARARALQHWADWCALAELHGADWRELAGRARRPAPRRRRRRSTPSSRQRAEFHAWLQWHADEQLAAAQQAALSGGHARTASSTTWPSACIPAARTRGRTRICWCAACQRGRAAGRVQPARPGLGSAAAGTRTGSLRRSYRPLAELLTPRSGTPAACGSIT